MKRYIILFLCVFLISPGYAFANKSEHRCPEFKDVAIQAGWPEQDWARIDFIIWRESRCKPDVRNKRGRDNSYGLMQLNMKAHKKWVGPLVEWDFDRLYDPLTNLTIARELYIKADDIWGCGWKPWTTKKTKWCSK